MKKENIDTFFANNLKDLAPPPNSGLWEAINHKMTAKRRKRRIIIFLSSGIAAAVLLLLAVSVSQLWHKTNHSPNNITAYHIKDSASGQEKNTENNSIQPQRKKEIGINHPAADRKVSKKVIAKTDYRSKQKFQNKNLTENNNTEKAAVAAEKELNQEAQIRQFIKKIPPVKKRTAVSANLNNSRKLPEFIHFYNDKSAERRLTAFNINLQKTKKTPLHRKWSLTGQVAAAYSSEKSADKSGIVNIGGGIKVNFKMGKRFALQTGISFNRYGQSYGETKQYNLRDAIHKDAFFSSHQTSLPAATPAGKITNSSTLKNNTVPHSAYSVYNIFSDVPENIEQHFDYIELPLLLRYNITEKQIGFFILGGFGINYLIDNSVYTTENHQKIGKIDNLKKTNITSQLGIGIEYRLSNKLKIGIEPVFKYHIKSLNSKEEYNYKPYSIGLHTGISIDF